MKTKQRVLRRRPRRKTTRVTVDFPISQHRRLKALAALEGVTLQEYIRSRVIAENVSEKELDPIIDQIIAENQDALKRLSSK